MINFKTTKTEAILIGKIARRASKMAEKHGLKYSAMTANMDVTACHANGTPLNLQKLFDADDLNFAHDVFGIASHINRETGKIERCFLPRCTA